MQPAASFAESSAPASTSIATLRFGMVAGETSGDLLAGLLLGGLIERWPGLETFGIGGPKMAERGFEAWWPYQKLAVRGYVEVLRHYREIAGIRRELATKLIAARPDAFIGVDAPDFNLGLEARLKAARVKAIHFVSPSIWAWRGKRVDKIRESVDHVLCLFPFEPEIYAKAGVPATYVGHPLADAIPLEVPRSAARRALGIADDATLVALLPGSRRSEIAYIAPTLLQAAVELQRKRPDVQFVLPVVPGLREMIEPLVAAHAPTLQRELLLPEGRSHEAMAASDSVIVASGTATLEAALFKRPMVVVYKMHWLSYQMMVRMAYLPWVGLPNILLRDFAVPELIQHDATPSAIALATLRWLDDAPRCAALARRFETLHHELRRDTARTATDAIAKIVDA